MSQTENTTKDESSAKTSQSLLNECSLRVSRSSARNFDRVQGPSKEKNYTLANAAIDVNRDKTKQTKQFTAIQGSLNYSKTS